MEKFSAEKKIECLEISQPENGYRFSVDPLILCAQIPSTGRKKMVEIGTGCGIISLLLAVSNPDLEIFGFEIQKDLVHFAQKNIQHHGLASRIRIIHGDINHTRPSDIGGAADMIVSNPPYKKKGTGRINPNRQRALARHEIHLNIWQVFRCAAKLLKPDGNVHLIFPADRTADLFSAMSENGFQPETIRFVHTRETAPAIRVIVCASQSASPARVLPPLLVEAPAEH